MPELIEKRSVDRIPDSERTTGFWPLFFLWTGFSISVARLWQGGVIASAGFSTAFVGLIASQVLVMYIAIGSIMGAGEGLPGTMIVRASFGIRGRLLPSIPLVIGTIGWFGLQLGITTSALDMIIGTLYGDWGVPMSIQYIIWAFLMGIISIYGYRVVMWFQKFVSPLLILLLPWMLYKMSTQFDLIALMKAPGHGDSGIFEIITFITGGLLAMVITAADSSRYARNRKVSVGGYVAAIWTVGTLIYIIGMFGTLTVGEWDPATLVDKLGLGFAGLLIVVLSAWSTNCLNPYWGGIALSTLTTGNKWFPNGIPRAVSTTIVVGVGAITTLAGIYSYAGFMTFVKVLSSTLGPVNGIIIADYFFLRGKGENRLDEKELSKVRGKYWYWKGWNPRALIAWGIGVVYTTVFSTTYILITPITVQILSGTLYLILMKTAGKRNIA